MARISFIIAVIAILILMDLNMATIYVPEEEWNNYKATYQKHYGNSPFTEAKARLNYATNKKLIRMHNALYSSGLKTYTLAVNQFTDMTLLHMKSLFPLATRPGFSNDKPAPEVQPAAPSYNPSDMGFKLNIENQGTNCNSGWAYAAAKSIELFKAPEMGDMNPNSLSAQNFIDCAGRLTACRNQVPQAAFDYLTQRKMNLYLEKDYKNVNNTSQPGMCTPPNNNQQLKVVTLSGYSIIENGDDESLKAYVSAGMPVIIEYNPSSFEFMHYSDGIFQPPISLRGSHFMVVIGYGTDEETGLDYWLLQNSFGITWGKQGLMKLHQSKYKKIAKNAIFPSES